MKRVLDFLFPLECIACGADGSHCCPSCLASVPMSPRFFDDRGVRAASAFPYALPIVRRLIHDLKYESWTVAADPIATLARRWAVKAGGSFCEPDAVLVPVPLS